MNDTDARCNDAARSELILRCKRGDQRAFAQLVEETQHLAYGLALRLLADEDEARDAVQEGFISVWRHLAAFDENRKFSTWLYAIVSNKCLDRLRRKRRAPVRFRGACPEDAYPASSMDHPEAVVANAELIDNIRRLTDQLSPSQRLVFVLRDLEELSVAEVVAITGLTADSIKTHLSVARRKLRQLLIEHYRIEAPE